MPEPLVWAESEALTERIRPPSRPGRALASFYCVAAVAWILPVHTVAALVFGLGLSAAALASSAHG